MSRRTRNNLQDIPVLGAHFEESESMVEKLTKEYTPTLGHAIEVETKDLTKFKGIVSNVTDETITVSQKNWRNVVTKKTFLKSNILSITHNS